jgi:SSS family transporter
MNQLNLTPATLLLVTACYFLLLSVISILTAKKSNNLDFFNGSKQSPWFVVAFGMVGATLSGATFISVPGWVHNTQFAYLQMVMGYAVGYGIIMYVLLPLYYKRNLISIYGYLGQRFGEVSHKTGSVFFIVSRVIGASFRLYLVTMVLYEFIFKFYGVPFWLAVLISLMLIWSYTVKGGIKTIIWTDTLQTFFMIAAILIAIVSIASSLDLDFSGVISTIKNHENSKTFFFEGGWADKNNFYKQFLAGALMAVVMTGLDQDMMQKNLSCKNLKESQKNMRWFFVILVLVNIVIMGLGVLLYVYANSKGIELPVNENGQMITDKVFPTIALNHMPAYLGIVFLVGILAAAYSSADSALTSLTTSYCVDIKNEINTPKRQRMMIHFSFTVILFVTIVVFKYTMNASAIAGLFTLAGYTYGPLLGLFAFGMFNKRQIKDQLVPIIAILSPVLTFIINKHSSQWFAGYQFGFELLLINGILMFLGLWLISKRNP